MLSIRSRTPPGPEDGQPLDSLDLPTETVTEPVEEEVSMDHLSLRKFCFLVG